MRARLDPWFSQFLLRVGDGSELSNEDDCIRIPDEMVIPYTDDESSMNELIEAIFPALQPIGMNQTILLLERFCQQRMITLMG